MALHAPSAAEQESPGILASLLAATIFFVLLFWESQRLVVLGFLTLLYLAVPFWLRPGDSHA